MPYFDDDMSELFQKASEEIRLRAEADDWDKIQKRLVPDASLLTLPRTRVITQRNLVLGIWLFSFFSIWGSGGFLINQSARKALIHKHEGKIALINKFGNNRSLKTEKMSLTENGYVLQYSKSAPEPETIKPSGAKLYFVNSEDGKLKTDLKLFYPAVTLAPIVLDLFPDSSGKGDSGKNLNKIKTAKIYVSVIAGPQISRTKQQGFSNAGLSAGLLAGFHLSNRFSSEAGLIISNKQYISAGQYFDMDKISSSMPAGTKLHQVQSKTTVLEIPFKIRYEIPTSNRSRAFVSAGFTSFILTSESNQYYASMNGNYETMDGHYSTHQNYFAAAINMSAGYEWNAGGNVNIRIEPYLQIPLKPIGMGSMNVTSAGIYLGITMPVVK